MLLDRAFILGILGKAVYGLVEVVLGVPLLLLGPAGVLSLAQNATAGELAEDPNDPIAGFLLREAAHLTAGATLWISLYLIMHGLVKVVLVIALMRGKRWGYPWMLAALAAFVVTQIVEMAVAGPGVGGISLTLFDAAMFGLTWIEWRRHRANPQLPVRFRDAWRAAGREGGAEADADAAPAPFSGDEVEQRELVARQ